MYKFPKNLFYLLLLVFFAIAGCQKKALDAFYGRPDSLAPPIYQTLQSKGNFTNLLACIDKADYTNILNSSGYWTMFAPDDAAFAKFFADPANVAKGITSIGQIDAKTAKRIVTYSLIYNASKTDHIADFQGVVPGSPPGYQPNQAFKRRTAYHEDVDTTTLTVNNIPNAQPQLLNQTINIVSTNVNGAINATNPYVVNDFNNKYIPYFTSSINPSFPNGGYFDRAGLSASDYNYFYPNSAFTGFNVIDGAVVNADIICENGVIHEVNTVVTPLPNLDEYLASNAIYSHFKQLFDKYMVAYVQDNNFTHLNQVKTGSSAPVYIKTFPGIPGVGAGLAFALNNESILGVGTSGQTLTYGLFAPANTQLDAYVNSVLLEHYPSIDKLPVNVIADLLNAQMFTLPLWPSKFSSSSYTNTQGEPARLNAVTDVFDPKVCSNGFFFGTTKINEPNLFSTVYGRVYLDPAYSMMKTILDASGIRNLITLSSFKFTIIMLSNAQLTAAGFSYNSITGTFSYNPPPGGYVSNTNAQALLTRIISMGVFRTDNNELNNVSGSGIYESAGLGGAAAEYVKFSGNKFFAAGNAENNTPVPVKVSAIAPNPSPKQTSNGITYYVNDSAPLLIPSSTVVNTVGSNLAKYGTNVTDPFYMFFQFLKNNSALYNPATGVITGVDGAVPFTVLVPSNTAIQDAVNNGWLPSTGTGVIKVANFNPSTSADVALVTNFIKYHLIKGFTVVPDGKKAGASFPTLLFNSNGDQVYLKITNSLNNMKVFDGQARIANVADQSTSVLANYAVLQSIDTYLQYIDPYSQAKY